MARKRSLSGYSGWSKPDFTKIVKTHKNFKTNYHGALAYAHNEFTPAALVKEIIKYLKTKDPKHPWIERIRHVNENRIACYGKYMYILNHNGELPDDVMANLVDSLGKTLTEEETKAAVPVEERLKTSTSSVPSIQDRIREKAKQVIGDIEGWLDDWITDKKTPVKTVEEFTNLFKKNDLKAIHMSYVKSAFEKRTKEFEQVMAAEDKELVEGYSNFKRLEIKKLVLMMRNLNLACDAMKDVAKVTRAPRKRKPVSIEKVVARLKYKKEDPQLGIVSMNPVHIVGSKEVWVYNTKTRKLGVYRAVDADGLTVKGTALLNYSPDSVEKTVRKPAETLAEFKKASKIKLRTFLKELTTLDVPCPGKLNENHVILRIDK